MAKYIRGVFVFLIFSVLAACGGGGGSAGNNSNGAALFTTASDKFQMLPGESKTFTIGGGIPAYTASSNSGAASVSVIGKTLTIVGGAGGGAATIIVKDTAGATVSIDVTISTGLALATSAPSSITVGVGTSSSVFGITGGSAIYAVASSNIGVASVRFAGSSFSVTGVAAGKATIAVKDSLGGSVSIDVTVGSAGSSSAIFTSAASDINVAVGAAAVYTVGGGTAPYSVGSSNVSVANAAIAGGTLTITGIAIGTSTVIVTDSAGTQVKINVVVGTSSALFTSATSSLNVGVGSTVGPFTIGGGNQVYSASSSNSLIASVSTNSGNKFIITGVTAGTATIVVKDGAGATISIEVKVDPGVVFYSTAPSDITLLVSASSSYIVGGGLGPYTATSNSTSVATASLTGSNLTIAAIASGPAKVELRDAAGTKITINVTVPVNPFYSTAPSDITLAIGGNGSYVLGGGTGPYTVASGNGSVVSATLAGNNTFLVSGISTGTANVVLRDALGALITLKITVSNAVTPLFTSAPAAITVAVGRFSSDFTVSGGSTVYTVISGDPQIATVVLIGNKFTITGVSVGKTTIAVKDNAGAATLIDVIVYIATPFFTTAPSSVTVAVPGSATYTVGGGTGPYVATSSNTGIAVAAVSGSSLNITGIAPGVVLVNLRDAMGANFNISVTVGSGVPSSLYSNAPNAITVAVGAIFSPTYQVFGGTAPYTVASSNTAIVTVAPSTVASAGGNFALTGIAFGSANVTITDATGKTLTLNVTVSLASTVPLFTTAPSSISLSTGAAPVYTVGGGTAPYLATSSDVKIATVNIVGGNVTITGIAPGTSNIVIFDAVGAAKTITVTVSAVTSITMVVAPSSATGYVGDILSFRVDGGTAPYTVISNNSAIATVTSGSVLSSAGSFTVYLAKVTLGGVNVVVADAQGKTQTINIDVLTQVSSLFFSPVVWTIDETNIAQIPLIITGGNGPFQVFTDNSLLSRVTGSNPDVLNSLTFNGRTVTVGLGTQASRCVGAAGVVVTITVVDSLGQTTTSKMTIKDLNGAVGC